MNGNLRRLVLASLAVGLAVLAGAVLWLGVARRSRRGAG